MVRVNPIRILSVEDHPVVREGLWTIVSSQADMVMVAQAGNAEEAVAEFRRHRPDVTLMDLYQSLIDVCVQVAHPLPGSRARARLQGA